MGVVVKRCSGVDRTYGVDHFLQFHAIDFLEWAIWANHCNPSERSHDKNCEVERIIQWMSDHADRVTWE